MITTLHEKTIYFSSPNANLITFNLFFCNHSGDNQEEKSLEVRKAYTKKAWIKAKKKAKAQTKKEARQIEAITRKTI